MVSFNKLFKKISIKNIYELQLPFFGKKVIAKNNRIMGIDNGTSDSLDSMLICHFDQRSAIVEQYRNLRNIILAKSKSENYKIISITSSLRNEGKTTTSSNLALIFASNPDLNILLIDADMRMPSIHKAFGITPGKGLSEFLQNKAEFDECQQNTFLGNLKIMPAGEPSQNPSELLSSKKMINFLNLLRNSKEVDIVIMDTPPIIPTTDPRVLASLVDASILVVQANKTFKDVISHSLTLFGEGKLIGVVLNNISGLSSYYTYYSSYAYGFSDYSQEK